MILHNSKEQLEKWKKEIEIFLREKLKLELHPDKSRIINLSNGVDFVGFRNFYYFKFLRKRSIRKMKAKINLFNKNEISQDKFLEIFQCWNAHSNYSNNYYLVKKLIKKL